MRVRAVFPDRLTPYLLLAPQLAVTLVFFIWPAFQALRQSVLVEDAFGLSTRFVWLENFARLFRDPNYLHSIQVTAVFSVAVAGALYGFLFDPTVGEVTYFLRAFGITWNYIQNGSQALVLVVVAASWNQISYNFVFLLAGLQSIPKSLIEAAALDGAGPGRRFWSVKFPLLSPTVFFLLTVNVVYAFFGTFGIIDVLTKGGPAMATDVMVYKVYSDSFRALDLVGSAAQSVILMAIMIALTVVQFRYVERQVHY